jgi:uncharacterized protein involved in exopolysaccharide biosynthesis
VLRYRRLVFGLPILLALAAVIFTFTRPRQYTSMASFMPRASESSRLAGLGGIAAQIGVNIPAGDPGQSPDFYADLVLSQEVLGVLAERSYAFRGTDGRARSGTLITLLHAAGDTPEERREDAIRELTKRVGVSRNLRTGLIQVKVRMQWPELAKQVATGVVDLVNDFNLRQRQARGEAERQFAEDRLRTIAAELRDAEESLATFEARNRTYRGSPELSAEHDRLSRMVGMRQQVFTSFSQLYEQARIDAVRNTPLIMVIDQPRIPARPDSRRGALRVILAVLGGVVIALLIAFWKEFTSAARADSASDYTQFQTLRREAAADLRHPIRALFRTRPRAS